MTKGVTALLIAQFFSAFSDNAILFAVIAIVLQAEQVIDWYVPALQAVFLLAFVFLAPWVGPFADSLSKPRVLLIGNLFKALGAGLIPLGVEPLFAYALVGLGAAVYSPAKYGILPELVQDDRLLKANSWIEASTIAAIILGAFIGGKLADHSVDAALWCIVGLYILSMAMTLLIPNMPARGGELKDAIPGFLAMIGEFLQSYRARFSMLGASLFWGTAAVLRVLLVAWAPLVLATRSAGDIAELSLFLAIGVIIGSALVPKLIPLEHLRRARLAAYAMGVMILVFATVESVWPARFVLFFIGVAGGMFVVPINTALQDIGHATVGSGRAVAMQNFFQNVTMLVTVALYTFAASQGVPPVPVIVCLGILVLASTWGIARGLSRQKP